MYWAEQWLPNLHNLCPPNLCPPQNMILFRNRDFADVIMLRSYWIRVGPKANAWCPSKKRKIWTWHTEGRQPHEDEGKSWSEVASCQRTPRIISITGNPQRLEREAKKDSFLEPSKGVGLCWLISDFYQRFPQLWKN